MSDPDRVLGLIDGALDDWSTGPDAMRWSPDPENAEPPKLPPRQELPEIRAPGGWCAPSEAICDIAEDYRPRYRLDDGGAEIRVPRGGIRYPVSEVRVTGLDESGQPTGDSYPLAGFATVTFSAVQEAYERGAVSVEVLGRELGFDETLRDTANEHGSLLDSGAIQVVRHRTIETDEGALLQAEALTPDGQVHFSKYLLGSLHLFYQEIVDFTWEEIDRRLVEQLRIAGFAEYGILIVSEDAPADASAAH